MKKLNYSEKLLLKIEKGEYKNVGKNIKEKNKYSATINCLIKGGFLNKDKNKKVKVTPKGIVKIQRIKWRVYDLKNLEDTKKCVVIFDIPENIRKMRDLFRKCLYELGFEKIQKSVFLGPQKSKTHIDELVKNCRLQKYVIIIVGNKIN